ncbi:MAG TPA: M15 family metallopeptidase [Candidatus Omnitrophota bacterium]|nr:M15 family metallopeptidase [Candidatus Omnitrophota bacterium]HPB69116.1 M15 family metallopeptidase [Candidatus Omnitrophota bacterium]HQO59012.1 M15 family metallopeptidase [Candidatus Omnitrophota bacterium]HQP11394.1 M15 family metallopeptidase [Candidatus Omnitrophota bacterium]
MKTRRIYILFLGPLFCFFCLLSAPVCAELNLDKLSDPDIQKVKRLITDLEPLIVQRDRTRDRAKLTFEELYAPLSADQKSFLKQFEKLNARDLDVKIPFRGISTGEEDLVRITGQKVKVRDHKKEGTDKDERELLPQFLPPCVYQQYSAMMDKMGKDIGKRLLIESGYRSSAYQLYLFVFYLRNHGYSIRETAQFVALPGYSEHGAPEFQAVDFISQDGINGKDDPAEFEALEEYRWLLKNARQFGFVLSYPKSSAHGIAYEPWHWRFEENLIRKSRSGKK